MRRYVLIAGGVCVVITIAIVAYGNHRLGYNARALIQSSFARTFICPSLDRDLARNAEGADVRELQQFLQSLAILGMDHITGNFGPVTEASVKRFQCTEDIVCSSTSDGPRWGVVEEQTRAAIIDVCTGRNMLPAGIEFDIPVSGATMTKGSTVAIKTTPALHRLDGLTTKLTLIRETDKKPFGEICSGPFTGNFPCEWSVPTDIPIGRYQIEARVTQGGMCTLIVTGGSCEPVVLLASGRSAAFTVASSPTSGARPHISILEPRGGSHQALDGYLIATWRSSNVPSGADAVVELVRGSTVVDSGCWGDPSGTCSVLLDTYRFSAGEYKLRVLLRDADDETITFADSEPFNIR